MKETNDIKKRYYFFLFWSLLTAVLLTISSYAWFSANRILGLRSFNIHIASKGGILISVDGIEWKEVVTLSDIMRARLTYPRSINQIPSSIEPVSTSGRVDNGKLRLFYGLVDASANPNENILSATQAVEEEGFLENSDGKFIAFDIFLKNHYEKTLYLSPESSIDYMTKNSTGIENAFRVGFLHQGTLPIGSSASQIQSLTNSNRAIIWEPNYDVHTESAVQNAYNRHGIVTRTNNATRIEYDGIYREIPTSSNVFLSQANRRNFPNYFERVSVDIATRKNFVGLQEIINLQPGISKLRLYIWIEGQDVDVEDNSRVGEILIDIQMAVQQRQQ